MATTFDLVHWQRVEGGLQVSAGARELHYPAESDVRSGVIYSYDLDRTGTLLPGGTPPAEPVLRAVDQGDGAHAVFTLSGADEGTVNRVYARLLAGDAWLDCGSITGDGGTLTAALAKGGYWAYAVSDGAGGRSASRPVSFTVTSADEEHYAQLRRTLRGRLIGTGALSGRLASPEAVYLDRAPEGAAAPRIVFTEGRAQNIAGGRELYYVLTVYAADRGAADALAELTRAAVEEGGGFDTAGWSVREVVFTGQVVRVPAENGGTGQLYAVELSFTLFAYETGVNLTLTLGESSLTLPPAQPDLQWSDLRRQAQGEALSGERYVYDRGAGRPQARLQLRALTAAERDGLRTFFQEVAVGCRNAFVLEGVSGGPWQARFSEPQLSWTQRVPGAYAVELALELQA